MYYEEKFQMVAQSRADFCTGQDDDMAGESSLSQITALLRAATISQADADGRRAVEKRRIEARKYDRGPVGKKLYWTM